MRTTRSMSLPSRPTRHQKSTVTPDASIHIEHTTKLTLVPKDSFKKHVLDDKAPQKTTGRLRDNYSIAAPSPSPIRPDAPTTASSSTSSIASTTVSSALIRQIKDFKTQQKARSEKPDAAFI